VDPFETPESALPSGEAGELNVATAIADGVSALLANALPATGVAFVGLVAYIVSICTCVGWIAILPLLMWGMYAFVLEMVDGSAKVQTALSGVEDFGRSFLSMWGLGLLYLVLYLPPLAATVALIWPSLAETMATGQAADPLDMTWRGFVPMFLWSLVAVRFMLTPFYVVDQGLGVLEAFTSAWRITEGSWLKLIALQVVLTLLSLPAQILNVGAQILGQDVDPLDTAAQLENLPLQLGMQGAIVVLSVVSGLLGLAIFASAYRQLAGPRPQTPATTAE
jgi:hypothetical protein